MDIEPLGLERWLAEYEREADIVLADGRIRALDASRFDLDPGAVSYVRPTNGDPEFRADVAERYGRSADEVLFTCGAREATLLSFLSLLGSHRGTHAVVVTPASQALYAVPEAFGEVTRVDLEPSRWLLDPDAIRDAVRGETAVVALANPNDPTGRYHSEEAIRAVYEVVADHDAYLLCDEGSRPFAEDPHPPVASLGDYGVSTTSLTEAYGLEGLRFGWIAAPRDVVDAAWTWKDYTTISPSAFGHHLAKQALGRRETRILDENRELARENRRVVADWADRLGLEWYNPVGVNGFLTVPDGFADARTFCHAVLEAEDVLLAPGDLFGFPNRFRLGFGLRTETLKRGLTRIRTVIRDRDSEE